MKSNQFQFDAIGTRWVIDFFDNPPRSLMDILKEKIFKRIEKFDLNYSRFKDNSLVRKISQKSGVYKMPPDFEQMISLYRYLYDLTGGLMTPLIGDTLDSLGYDSSYSLVPRNIVSPVLWDDAMSYKSGNLYVKKPVLLDFGACGKGYLVDIIAGLIRANGIHHYCVDGGGDMYINSLNNIKIGLESPADTSKVIGFASLSKGAICGSSGNRRKWSQFHHIVNPKTLESPKNILAVWVMAKTTILADALTTALFFKPVIELQKQFVFEYVILYDDGKALVSKNFPGEIFSK